MRRPYFPHTLGLILSIPVTSTRLNFNPPTLSYRTIKPARAFQSLPVPHLSVAFLGMLDFPLPDGQALEDPFPTLLDADDAWPLS